MIADKPIIFWFQVLQMVPKLKPRRDKGPYADGQTKGGLSDSRGLNHVLT